MNLPAKRGPKPQGITNRMREAVKLNVNGLSQRAIAEQLGVSAMAVSKWFAREDVSALRHRLVTRKIDEAMGRATDELIKQMDDANPWIRQNAAREIVRMYTENRKQDTQEAGTAVVFENMPSPGAPESAELPGDAASDYEEVIDSEAVDVL